MEQDPYRYFRAEARELLEQIGKGILELEKGPPAPDLVAGLLRLAHTLKGAARVVKQVEIAELAHAIEGELAPLRERASPLPRSGADRVLGLLDAIAQRVGALAPAGPADSAAAPRPRPDDGFRTLRAEIADMDALLEGMTGVGVQVRSLRHALGVVERTRHLTSALQEHVSARRRLEPEGGRQNPASVKAGSMIEELRGLVAGLERDLAAGLDQLDLEMRDVRDRVERLRLLPAGLLSAPLERAARDTAQTVGKRVDFELKGGDVRLDAHVLGVLQGALLQLVRNAVAHGIEPEAERVAAGKPPAGRVVLGVGRRGKQVVCECRDDGRGVDIEAVRRAARQKGLLSDEGRGLGAAELLRLLLQGGLTTSGAVTEVSGRGIGLDVVRETVSRLGGQASVHTEAGVGTTLELVVPLSLASLDALLLEDSSMTAYVPLEAVRGVLRVDKEGIAHAPDGDSLLHEGRSIPFVALAPLLGASDARTRADQRWSAVVVDGGGALVALGAERLRGSASIVLRPLPAYAPAEPIVAGVTLDAEGSPQVVIDPAQLPLALRAGRSEAGTTHPQRQAVLVVDDSLTTRMLEQSILESAGYEVDLATSGEEALEKALRRAYGIFLVDVEMPGMDGFTFVERARAEPALRHVPSILVTSRNAPEDRQRGATAGAGAYIVKSEFDQQELLETIRRLLG